jgi:glycosyltransferase involved in cell wall biosynthesis
LVAGDFVETGGMDRANYALADWLSREGREVELVCHRAAPALTERPNVTLERVPKPLGSYMLGEPLLDGRGRWARRRSRGTSAVTLTNGGNCQAGQVNWVHYVHAAYPPVLARSLASARHFAYGAHARRLERRALERADLVIANSAATGRVLVDRVGISAAKVRVVYYGIDAGLFRPAAPDEIARARAELGFSGRPVVAFIGALGDRRKGFDTLFEAWCRLCKKSSWDADLVAVGAGSELESWRARAAAAGLASRIRLLGFRRDVPRVLSACDLLVSATRYEAFGLGVAEALATGLPALVSRAAGVAELYPEELGSLLLDEPESASELERKLGDVRAHLDDAKRRVRALSERVRSRSWDAMALDIDQLIETSLG